jgi:hypothetical protein
MTALETTYAESVLNQGLLRRVLLSFAQRAAFALGMVLGIALLGALAFTTRTDVRVVWFDETGRVAIGMQRTTTQEQLDRVTRELTETKRLLAAEKARTISPGAPQAGTLEQAVRAAELKARQAEKLADRAQKTILEQKASIDTLKGQTAELDHARAALLTAMGDKDQEIKRLNEQIQASIKPLEYHAALGGDQGYLPLRDKPQRASRVLKAIPPGGAVRTNCKLVVTEDAVFVESMYQGITGWVSSFYLASAHGQ